MRQSPEIQERSLRRSAFLVGISIWAAACSSLGMGWPGVDRQVPSPTPFVTQTPADPEPNRLFNLVVRLRRTLLVEIRRGH